MHDVDPSILDLYRILDLIGVVLNGIIGGTIARQRKFDIIGFAFLAIFSALAGGMIRDVLIMKGTPAAIAEPSYLGFAILGGILALFVHVKGHAWEIFKTHGDAIILGVWSVTGSTKALAYGMPWGSAIFMGVVTAVGGGMIRDVFSGSVPSIFGGNTLYATPAITASTGMVVFHHFGHDAVGMVVSTGIGAGFAIIAYWRGWVLPSNPEWAPVNMTAAQLAKAMKNAERRGRRAGTTAERDRWRDAAERGEVPEGEDAAGPLADPGEDRGISSV